VPRHLQEKDLNSIVDVVRQSPDGTRVSEIAEALKSRAPRRTIQYWLRSLVDERRLIKEGEKRGARYRLPAAAEAQKEAAARRRGVVVFWGIDRDKRIRCAISQEALDDHFHGDNTNKIAVFRENLAAIEEIARRKYLSGRVEPDGTVLIRTADIA
jgi:hypothetical protein